MKKPSLALTALIIFWAVYGLVAAVVLYETLAPLNRELFMILGGTAVILVITTLALLRHAPSDASVGGHGR
jgi:hypothetical protein